MLRDLLIPFDGCAFWVKTSSYPLQAFELVERYVESLSVQNGPSIALTLMWLICTLNPHIRQCDFGLRRVSG